MKPPTPRRGSSASRPGRYATSSPPSSTIPKAPASSAARRSAGAATRSSLSDAGEVLRIDRLVLRRRGRRAGRGGCSTTSCSHAPDELDAYRAQLLRYRAAVARAQPGDAVRCAFVTGDGQGGGARVTVQRFTARNLTFPVLIAPSPGAPVRSNQANSVPLMPSALAPLIRSSSPPRAFGHFALRRLLGKSELTMVWLAIDNRTGTETLLSMPRLAPTGAVEHRQLAAHGAARGAAGSSQRRQGGRVRRPRSLAVRRRRPQRRRDPRGVARPASAAFASRTRQRGSRASCAASPSPTTPASRTSTCSCSNILDQRARPGERDGTRCRPLPRRMHARRRTTPRPTAGGADRARRPARATRRRRARRARLRRRAAPPARRHAGARPRATSRASSSAWRRAAASSFACPGRRRTRSPSRCARSPIAAPRRRCACAIATRAPSSARSTGWLEATADDNGGPLALLLDRLRTVGHLPALPGLATRVQRVTSIESQRTDEIARHLLPDMALSFELLRTLSSARVQGTQIAGQRPGADAAPRRRADRRRRRARRPRNSLRIWPGPLDDEGAHALRADDRSSPPRRPCRAGAAAGRLRRRGRVPRRGAAEPRAAAAALPLRRRGRADPPADAARSRRRAAMARPPVEQPGLDEDAAAYRRARRRHRSASATRSRATGASATTSCT